MKRPPLLLASVFTLAVVAPLPSRTIGQMPKDPWELERIFASKTITDKARALHLPPHTYLEAVFDWNRDGRAEIFASRTERVADRTECEFHLFVLSEQPRAETRVEHEYVVRAECQPWATAKPQAWAWVQFYAPPDNRDAVKMVIETPGGAYWMESLDLIEAGFERPVRLFDRFCDFEFLDMNGDGVYEAVAWDRRPTDERCPFGMFAVRVAPQISVRDRAEFHSVWPSRGAGWRGLMAQFADLDRDGLPEIVALEDDRADSADAVTRSTAYTQRLAVYKITGKTVRAIADAAVPSPDVAFWLTLDETGRVELQTASPEKCAAGGMPSGEGTAFVHYELRGGVLRRVQ